MKLYKNCLFCGLGFKTGYSKKKYCTEACRRLKEQINKITYNYKCKRCNAMYTTNKSLQTYCSRECSLKEGRERSKKRYTVSGCKNLRLRFDVLKKDNFTCVYCGRNPKEDGVKLEVDHVKPLSKGGENIITNLVTACKDCNNGKSNTIL